MVRAKAGNKYQREDLIVDGNGAVVRVLSAPRLIYGRNIILHGPRKPVRDETRFWV